MAPNLTSADRLAYLQKERAFVEEMLEDDDDDEDGASVDDCKWIYQRLVEIVLIRGRVKAVQAGRGTSTSQSTNLDLSSEEKADMKQWLKKLHSLDPLRRGRWSDLEKSLRLEETI